MPPVPTKGRPWVASRRTRAPTSAARSRIASSRRDSAGLHLNQAGRDQCGFRPDPLHESFERHLADCHTVVCCHQQGKQQRRELVIGNDHPIRRRERGGHRAHPDRRGRDHRHIAPGNADQVGERSSGLVGDHVPVIDPVRRASLPLLERLRHRVDGRLRRKTVRGRVEIADVVRRTEERSRIGVHAASVVSPPRARPSATPRAVGVVIDSGGKSAPLSIRPRLARDECVRRCRPCQRRSTAAT